MRAEILHFRTSTPTSIVALPTMLDIADLLAPLASLFDTLLAHIPLFRCGCYYLILCRHMLLVRSILVTMTWTNLVRDLSCIFLLATCILFTPIYVYCFVTWSILACDRCIYLGPVWGSLWFGRRVQIWDSPLRNDPCSCCNCIR